MKSKDHPYKGHFYILLSTFGFSLVPIIAKFSLDNGMNAETILTYRFLIAGAFFMLYSFHKKIKLYTDLKTSFKLLAIGFLYALESACFFEAFKYISPSIGQLIFQVNPLMVAFSAYFVFKDKITKNVMVALLLTSIGCSLLFWEPSAFITPLGIFLVLLSAFFYTAYIIVGKEMLKNIEPMVVTTYTTAGCGFFLLLYSLISGKLLPVNDIGIIGAIIVLVVFSTIVSILTFAMGLKLLGATAASIISALEPVFTVAIAYLLFSENLNFIQILGGLLIVLSIVVIDLKFNKKETPTLKKNVG